MKIEELNEKVNLILHLEKIKDEYEKLIEKLKDGRITSIRAITDGDSRYAIYGEAPIPNDDFIIIFRALTIKIELRIYELKKEINVE